MCSYSDDHEIEEAFKRLNIKMLPKKAEEKEKQNDHSATTVRNENCDKKSSHKLSKLATLLPKSGTLKGTIKIKRKRQNKKSDSSPVP